MAPVCGTDRKPQFGLTCMGAGCTGRLQEHHCMEVLRISWLGPRAQEHPCSAPHEWGIQLGRPSLRVHWNGHLLCGTTRFCKLSACCHQEDGCDCCWISLPAARYCCPCFADDCYGAHQYAGKLDPSTGKEALVRTSQSRHSAACCVQPSTSALASSHVSWLPQGQHCNARHSACSWSPV